MCGIVGVTGLDDARAEILAGLERLEYRGYDSAGVVIQTEDGLRSEKRAGKLEVLTDELEREPWGGSCGLGHTRWATHGAPTDRNAHPHSDPLGRVAIVHNGIIENHAALRAELAEPEAYVSETDSEVIAHLVARAWDELATGGEPDLLEAVRRTVARLEGAYALAVMHAEAPGEIVVARQHAPLVVAAVDGAALVASDVAALIVHTRKVAALVDGQLGRLRPGELEVIDADGQPTEPHRFEVDWDMQAAQKRGYEHFMRKEIFEQPDAVRASLRGRLVDGRIQVDQLAIDENELARIDKVFVVACGTSLHAGMIAKLAIEHWAQVPVEVEVASEFRYRDPILGPHTLVVAISQSGETADTLAAAEHAIDQRAPVMAVCNVVGSTLARQAHGVIYTRAGPEVGVAATKTFTTQLVACLLLGLFLGQCNGTLFPSECTDLLERLGRVPALLEQALENDGRLAALADRYHQATYTMFIGRQAGLPVAYEGALKLKEISYLHAEAFAAGEMKHGPIALIEDGSLVVAVAPRSHVLDKMVSNIREVKARGADVIAIATEGSTAGLAGDADHLITVPRGSHELVEPVLATIPLQLFAYHVATSRGTDVDQPRNLAKTVTVE